MNVIKAIYKGVRVDVPVCWDARRVSQCVALHPPDGIVDIENQGGPGDASEQEMFRKMTLNLLKKQGTLPK